MKAEKERYRSTWQRYYIAGRTNNKKGMYYPKLLPEENRIINKYRSLSEKNKGRLIERLGMLSGKKQ